MDRAKMSQGLELLVQLLGNERINMGNLSVPNGFTAQEWAYVKGIASGAVMRLRDQIVRDLP